MMKIHKILNHLALANPIALATLAAVVTGIVIAGILITN